MTEIKKQKWGSGVSVSKGKQASILFETYQTELKPRFPDEERAQFEANLAEFEKRLPGQQTNLAGQKSSTSAQDEVIKKVNKRVVSIRGIVMASNPGAEIKNAYAVGSKLQLTVSSASSSAQVTIAGYNLFKVWSNKAGILQKDIDELTTLEASLFTADDSQEKTIYTRKAATMDKNTLHREVEDGITKISALGFHEFELANPSVAKLFADLIPSAPAKAKKKDAKDTKASN